MFRISKSDALSLGNALIDAVEYMNDEGLDVEMAIERHDEGLFPLPKDVAGENTVMVVVEDQLSLDG